MHALWLGREYPNAGVSHSTCEKNKWVVGKFICVILVNTCHIRVFKRLSDESDLLLSDMQKMFCLLTYIGSVAAAAASLSVH